MASNAEFIAQAEELAAGLGKEITTEGLNNAQLGSLVKELRAEAEADAKANRTDKGDQMKVVLQCKYGKKGPGDPVDMPKDVAEKAIADGWAKGV